MQKLLLVFAHPDDESFACGGTIPKYIEAGWEVDILCATRGEAGQAGSLGELTPEKLGEARQKELEKAATLLGIHSITFMGYRDGKLSSETPGELEDKIHQKMLELVPDCVITMDTSGISNHPDHIKLCFATTYAFQQYAEWVEDQLRDQEDAEAALPKLYYACMPESVALYLKKKKSIPEESFGKPWRGTPDKFITTVIDISEFASLKKKALALHVSQQEELQRFLSVASHPLLHHEYFILRMQGTTEVFMGKNDTVSNTL